MVFVPLALADGESEGSWPLPLTLVAATETPEEGNGMLFWCIVVLLVRAPAVTILLFLVSRVAGLGPTEQNRI